MSSSTRKAGSLKKRILASAAILLSMALPALGATVSPTLRTIYLPGAPASGELARKTTLPEFGTVSNLQLLRKTPLAFSLAGQTDLRLKIGGSTSGENTLLLKEFSLDWRNPEKKRDFAVKTSEPKARRAVWQVATLRFSPDTRDWQAPPGLVASGNSPFELSPAKGLVTFSIDFSRFAPRAPGEKPAALHLAPASQPLRVTSQPSLATPVKPGLIKPVTPIKPITPIKPLVPVRMEPEPLTPMQVVYFVRVVTLDQSGQPVGLPSSPVRILYGETPEGSIKYVPQAFEKKKVFFPTVRPTHYVPLQIEKQGAMYHYVVFRDMPMLGYKAGDKLDFTPHPKDKGILDVIGDFVDGLVDFVSGAVNWVSTAYEDIKKMAVDLAVNISGQESLRGLFELGLNIGMSAIGLPPNIPNFDVLCGMGKDYLVETIASSAGVDEELAGRVADKFIEETRKAGNGGGNPNNWFKPDPDFFYRPGYVEMTVTNPHNVPTSEVMAIVEISTVDKETGRDLTLYQDGRVTIPALAPGKSFTVPVFLEEYLENRYEDHDYYAGVSRFWSNMSHPAKLAVVSYGGGDPMRVEVEGQVLRELVLQAPLSEAWF